MVIEDVRMAWFIENISKAWCSFKISSSNQFWDTHKFKSN